jgi:uncharacterized membrane protein SpoIIM required for sporulation
MTAPSQTASSQDDAVMQSAGVGDGLRPPPAPAGGEKQPLRPALVLRSTEFRRGREQGWQDLEGLLAKAERGGLGALSTEELQRLPLLHRSAMSALSVARAIALDRHLLLYLENLGLRSFLVVYGPRKGMLESCREFFTHGFPAAVRAAGIHILIAFLSIAVGAAAGFILTKGDESWLSMIVPSDLSGGRGITSTREQLLSDEIFAPWPGFTRSFVTFANFLFRHNTLIGIMTFGLGIAAGVPTLMLLTYQGLVFGAFIALHANRDLLVDFLGWVSIHGVTEFGAIILCGAGGLVIAQHILFPGRYSRVDSLAAHGRSAAQLAVGAVLLFFIAGLIEGGMRQLVSDTTGRFAIAALTGIAWFSYFVFAGRGLHRERVG